ncbi:MAG: SGNH/GDSL hydrolase family protein [Pirellula sp.]
MPRATYETVPYFAGDTSIFRKLFQSALSAIQRIAYIGDSQETNPGGAGGALIHRLNCLAFHMFGPPSETVVSCVTGAVDQFVVRPMNYSFTGSASNYTNNQMAGKTLAAMSATDEGGYAVQLRPRSKATGIAVSDDKELFFPITNAALRAKIWFAGNSAGPNNARVYYQPVASGGPNYYADIAATHITAGLKLSSIGDNNWASYETPILAYDAAKPFPSITIQGWNGSAIATGLVCGGVRYRDANRNQGMVFDTFSVGGYTAQDFLSHHSTAHAQFNQYGPWHCIFSSFGTNETGLPTTEDAFKTVVENLIALWRGPNWQQSAVPIVLVADPPRLSDGTDSIGYATFLRNAAIFAEIATETTNVLAINGTRLMAETGYHPATHGDGVHPNDTWNGIRAELIWHQLIKSFLLPSAPSTCRVRVVSTRGSAVYQSRLHISTSSVGTDNERAIMNVAYDALTDVNGEAMVDLPWSSRPGAGKYRFRFLDPVTREILHDRTRTVPDEINADYSNLPA